MAKIAILFGALLIGLGLVGYFGVLGDANSEDGKAAAGNSQPENANKDSSGDADERGGEATSETASKITAFIPAGFGILILIFGVIALNDRFRMHAMHGAVLFGLLGFLLGLGRGLMTLVKLMSGADDVNIRAMIFVWIMVLLCGIFVFLCVQSFRNARKQREAAE